MSIYFALASRVVCVHTGTDTHSLYSLSFFLKNNRRDVLMWSLLLHHLLLFAVSHLCRISGAKSAGSRTTAWFLCASASTLEGPSGPPAHHSIVFRGGGGRRRRFAQGRVSAFLLNLAHLALPKRVSKTFDLKIPSQLSGQTRQQFYLQVRKERTGGLDWTSHQHSPMMFRASQHIRHIMNHGGLC